MKNVNTAIFLIFLLIPSLVFANPKPWNEVGLYLTEDGTGASGTNEIGSLVDVYLVLTRPSKVENHYVPASNIFLFQLTLRFAPVPNNDLLVMSALRPPNSLDVGQRKDINEGFLDFNVGVPEIYPHAVTRKSVVLISFIFLNLDSKMTEVYLEPEPDTSIPGKLVFQPEIKQYRYMYPISGSFETPVFVFNGEVVAVENESFGSVKALFH